MSQQVRAVPAVPPVGTLVVTVGGSPVPVLLALLTLRPQRVVAVHTADSRVVWERVEALYRQLAAGDGGRDAGANLVTVESIQVAPHNPQETIDALAPLSGDAGWSLSYVGGTPSMSAAAFMVWWNAHAGGQPGPADANQSEPSLPLEAPGAWYAAEDGDVLLRHDGLFVESRDTLQGVEVGLADLMRLHGAEPGGDESHWQAHVPNLSPYDVVSQLVRMPRTFAPHQRQEVEKGAAALITEGLALLAERGGRKAYRVGPFHLIDAGIQVQPGASADVAIVGGLSLAIVRLTLFPSSRGKPKESRQTAPKRVKRIGFGWRPGELKEQLFDAEGVAHALGGLKSRAAVLTLGEARRGQAPAEVVAVLDVGPDFRPERLGSSAALKGVAVEPQPDLAGFNGKDLTQALIESAMDVPLTDSDDFSRWVAWETEL